MSDVPIKELLELHVAHLRDTIQLQVNAVDRFFEERITSLRSEVAKAEHDLRTRLAGMNEFRETLKDQAARLATKDEMFTLVGSFEKRLNVIENSSANSQGKLMVVVAIITASISVVIGVILRLLKL